MDSLVHEDEFGVTVHDADIDPAGGLWLGHVWAGLVNVSLSTGRAHGRCPAGPTNDDYVYSMTATPEKLYLCPGGKRPTYESMSIDGNLLTYDGKEWINLQSSMGGWEYPDVLYAAVDPTDKNHLSATSWGKGVLDIRNNQLQTIYTEESTNNVLAAYRVDDFKSLRVSGVAYDNEGNLWVTNSLVDHGLAVRYKDGTWKSFNTSAMVQGKEIDKIVWDSVRGYKWILGRANRIYVHDGKSKQAYVDPNYGSKLETHAVTCLVQDRTGDMWFGTDKGIKVIYDGYRAFSNGGNGEMSPVVCSNILYNEDGIYEYLMAYESITCIAVDGANRKWVGTSNNGLYLISANGQKQLQHFTTANSPLASDKIVALSVHPTSGEIYIAIKGFTQDALVHITDAAGHTVFSTQALGGQAIWNGCNLEGKPVSSGVYYVFGSNNEGAQRSVTKILIVR